MKWLLLVSFIGWLCVGAPAASAHDGQSFDCDSLFTFSISALESIESDADDYDEDQSVIVATVQSASYFPSQTITPLAIICCAQDYHWYSIRSPPTR